MTYPRLLALLLFVAAVFVAFGWFVDQSTAHAVGLIAGGLALALLPGPPVAGRGL